MWKGYLILLLKQGTIPIFFLCFFRFWITCTSDIHIHLHLYFYVLFHFFKSFFIILVLILFLKTSVNSSSNTCKWNEWVVIFFSRLQLYLYIDSTCTDVLSDSITMYVNMMCRHETIRNKEKLKKSGIWLGIKPMTCWYQNVHVLVPSESMYKYIVLHDVEECTKATCSSNLAISNSLKDLIGLSWQTLF